MNFWDSSALVALFVDEPNGSSIRRVFDADEPMAVWWGTPVEFASALARKEREGSLRTPEVTGVLGWFDGLAERWHEVQPDARIRQIARRLLRVHPLTSADALQLAAALAIGDEDPAKVGFVCLDVRLNHAASREGFHLRGTADPRI